MTTVNLGVICKSIFAFLPENIGVSVRLTVSSFRLSISLHRSIAQNHKSSSVVNGPRNGPAPHEYGQGSLKNEIQVNAIR